MTNTKTSTMRRFVLCTIFLFSGIIFGEAAAGDKLPHIRPLTLHFDFYYQSIKAAEVSHVLTSLPGGDYEITSQALSQGLAKILYGDVKSKSTGIISTAGLQMRRYETKRGSRPLQTAQYDSETKAVQLRKGDETRTEPAPDNAPLLDYLTALYRPHILRRAISGMQAVTNGWRLKVYEYNAGEPELIETPAGNFMAVPIRRDSPRGERIFWVSPALDYLPVKIQVDDKGHVFQTILTGITDDQNILPTDDQNILP